MEADRYDAASVTDRSKLLNKVCNLLFMLHGICILVLYGFTFRSTKEIFSDFASVQSMAFYVHFIVIKESQVIVLRDLSLQSS